MRRLTALAAASALTVSSVARADEPPAPDGRVRFSLRPEIGLQGGSEVYELAASVQGISVRSTLTYPVDVVLAGGRASLRWGVLEVVGALHLNVSNPTGKMVDQDFIQGIELSNTESRTEAKMLIAELAGHVQVAELSETPGVAPLSLVAGFRHATNAFDVYGLSGVQHPDGVTSVPVSLPDSVHGLHYQSRYEMPFVGARIDGRLSDTVRLAGEGRALAAWSSHEDDHLLRHKLAHADVQAFGWALTAELTWTLGKTFFVGAYGEAQILHGSGGTLKQHFYADDPFTTQVEGPDTAIPDSQFSYKNDRWKALLYAGAAF